MNPGAWMKTLTVVALCVWIACSIVIGTALVQKRQTTDDQICTLSKTFVTTELVGLSHITQAEVRANPQAYHDAYTLGSNLIVNLANEAPCDIHYKIPPEVKP